MNGYYTFIAAVIKRSLQLSKGRQFPDEPEISKAYAKYLMGLGDVPRTTRQPTQEEKEYEAFFRAFREIYKSYEQLLDIPIYMRSFPNRDSFRKRGITKSRYLRYHIENYLHEIYILRNRLLAFLKVAKKHSCNPRNAHRIVPLLQDTIGDSLKNGISIRSNHVHKLRYETTDLERLNTLDFWAEHPIPDDYAADYGNAVVYKLTRRKWISQIDQNNAEIKKLLDAYFEAVHPLFFEGNEQKQP